MVNIIPMSGSGSRFTEAGFLLPKPLISVSGKPMIARVIEAMPGADRWVFVVREEHAVKFGLDKYILSLIPGATIVLEEKPWGQAPSCMEAVIGLADNDEVFIAACDNSFMYNKDKFEKLRQDKTVDAMVWTFTDNILLQEKPEAWGWTKINSDGRTIDDMSVKVPVSDNPMSDHAVIGAFYFKRAGDFKTAYDLMVKQDCRINNEFYVDSMPIFYKQMGKRSVIFDIDLYVGWGKPRDYHYYELRDNFYGKNGQFGICPDSEKEAVLWGKYFANLK